jgi:hypothetical protein
MVAPHYALLCRVCDAQGVRTCLLQRSGYVPAWTGHCCMEIKGSVRTGTFLPHHDSEHKPYKIGKVYCNRCGHNLGNVQTTPQNNLQVLKHHVKKINILVETTVDSRYEKRPLHSRPGAAPHKAGSKPTDVLRGARTCDFHKAMCFAAEQPLPHLAIFEAALRDIRGEEPMRWAQLDTDDSDCSFNNCCQDEPIDWSQWGGDTEPEQEEDEEEEEEQVPLEPELTVDVPAAPPNATTPDHSLTPLAAMSALTCSNPTSEPGPMSGVGVGVGVGGSGSPGGGNVVVHWDVENVAVPHGASVIQTCKLLRGAIKEALHCKILDLYVYADVATMSPKMRQDMRLAGADVIDVSSVQGKSGQVDLAILARALKSTEGVCIVTGDADYAYTLSVISNSGRLTAIVYNKDNLSSVSTSLLEVADYAIGVALNGSAEEADYAIGVALNGSVEDEDKDPPPPAPGDKAELMNTWLAQKKSATPIGSTGASETGDNVSHPTTTPPAAAPQRLTYAQRGFLDAVRRAPEVCSGWKGGPTVGTLFHKMVPSSFGQANQRFKTVKSELIDAGMLVVNPNKSDTMRLGN